MPNTTDAKLKQLTFEFHDARDNFEKALTRYSDAAMALHNYAATGNQCRKALRRQINDDRARLRKLVVSLAGRKDKGAGRFAATYRALYAELKKRTGWSPLSSLDYPRVSYLEIAVRNGKLPVLLDIASSWLNTRRAA
jgi:hypothetical protein